MTTSSAPVCNIQMLTCAPLYVTDVAYAFLEPVALVCRKGPVPTHNAAHGRHGAAAQTCRAAAYHDVGGQPNANLRPRFVWERVGRGRGDGNVTPADVYDRNR